MSTTKFTTRCVKCRRRILVPYSLPVDEHGPRCDECEKAATVCPICGNAYATQADVDRAHTSEAFGMQNDPICWYGAGSAYSAGNCSRAKVAIAAAPSMLPLLRRFIDMQLDCGQAMPPGPDCTMPDCDHCQLKRDVRKLLAEVKS